MIKPAPSLSKQAGILLLEGLIAILIFSLGILAIVGTQAMAVKQVTDAQYRSQAALLANRLLGQMWVSNRTASALATSFGTGGSAYNSWLNDVSAALPGTAANAPDVQVSTTGSTVGTVTITIKWLAPNEPTGTDPHKYITIAQIR